MKRILAVSGGVDSMVMLDFFAKNFPREELAVATFDHKSRESSGADAEFVSEVASALEIPVYRGELEKKADFLSEEKAREARYKFLFKVAFLEKGEIYTAQHLDDLVESVAINLIRGTGPRGVAVLSRAGVRRPFLDERLVDGAPWGREEVLRYAAENGVRFRLDPSNYSDRYLRNRVRGQVFELSRERKLEIFKLWKEQRERFREIDEIIENLIPEDLTFKREMFREVTPEVGREILRVGLARAGVRATGPQLEEFRQAILSYLPGKKFNLPEGRLVKIGRESFQLRV